MKILCPSNNPSEIEDLIQAGAEEIFVGVLPEQWKKRYHNSVSANRRETSNAQYDSFDDVRKAVEIAARHNVPVFLAMNGNFTDSQLEIIRSEMTNIAGLGISAIIVADIGLLELLIEDETTNIPIHISTLGLNFNSETIAYYASFGKVTRVILDRQVTVDEIKMLTSKCDGVEIEIFAMNSACNLTDGACGFSHSMSGDIAKSNTLKPALETGARKFVDKLVQLNPKLVFNKPMRKILNVDQPCVFDYTVSEYKSGSAEPMKNSVEENVRNHFYNPFGRDACCACSLFELKGCKVDSLKIVGRDRTTSKKVMDASFLRKARELLNSEFEKEGYRKKVQAEYKKTYGFGCSHQCYYYENEYGNKMQVAK